MNIVTACSGVDAIAYAAELLDIDLIGQIEIDKFCNAILELRYPGIKRLENVFDVKGDEFGTVDIIAFGDPCQPHSVAGKQKGTADERYIWPELFRIIQTMRPAWIINENVTGSVSNGVVLGKIMQLESEGYRARAFVIPACSVGAPHLRYRVILVGNTCSPGRARANDIEKSTVSAESSEVVAYSGSRKLGEQGVCGQQQRGTKTIGTSETMADTESSEFKCTGSTWGRFRRFTDGSDVLADAGRAGWEERNASGEPEGQRHNTGCSNAPGGARAAQSGMGGVFDGFPERIYKSRGQEDSEGVFAAFEAIFTTTLEQILWPAGYGQSQCSWEPPRVATGIKNRTNRLKALGNAIVWQQIYPFLLAIKLIGGQNG